MTLHVARMDEARVNFTRHEYEMLGDGIFEFVASCLRTAEELEITSQAFGQMPVLETAKTSLKPLDIKTVVVQPNSSHSTPKGKARRFGNKTQSSPKSSPRGSSQGGMFGLPKICLEG